MTTIRQRTLKRFGAGDIRVVDVRTRPGERRATFVDAKVNGHRGLHTVTYGESAGWSCSCGCAGDALAPCPHVAAVQMVTGHPSAAEKPTRGEADDG